MKLLDNVPFDITEYCGNLIVTYLSDDKESVQHLLTFLNQNGYEYVENEVGLHTVLKSAYLSGMQDHLNTCGCYILYLTDSFNAQENRVLKNNILYQIGFLEARREQIIVPYVEQGANIDLSKSPLQQANIIRSTSEVLDMLKGSGDRFRSVIMQNSFYADSKLNHLTKDRIEYRRMLIELDINKKDFKNAFAKYRAMVNELNMTEKEFVNALRDNLSCGARLLSFGTQERITTHLSPYLEEMRCVNTLDFPVSFSCAHIYKEDNGKGDRKATYTLEVILPIHKLLGVNFKPFMRAKAPLNTEVLKLLFASNFSKKNDAVVNGNTLYFSLDFPNAEPFDFDPALNIGKIADYLYPQ